MLNDLVRSSNAIKFTPEGGQIKVKSSVVYLRRTSAMPSEGGGGLPAQPTTHGQLPPHTGSAPLLSNDGGSAGGGAGGVTAPLSLGSPLPSVVHEEQRESREDGASMALADGENDDLYERHHGFLGRAWAALVSLLRPGPVVTIATDSGLASSSSSSSPGVGGPHTSAVPASAPAAPSSAAASASGSAQPPDPTVVLVSPTAVQRTGGRAGLDSFRGLSLRRFLTGNGGGGGAGGGGNGAGAADLLSPISPPPTHLTGCAGSAATNGHFPVAQPIASGPAVTGMAFLAPSGSSNAAAAESSSLSSASALVLSSSGPGGGTLERIDSGGSHLDSPSASALSMGGVTGGSSAVLALGAQRHAYATGGLESSGNIGGGGGNVGQTMAPPNRGMMSNFDSIGSHGSMPGGAMAAGGYAGGGGGTTIAGGDFTDGAAASAAAAMRIMTSRHGSVHASVYGPNGLEEHHSRSGLGSGGVLGSGTFLGVALSPRNARGSVASGGVGGGAGAGGGALGSGSIAASRIKRVPMVRISVVDKGIGISKEEQRLLFRPFTQIRAGAAQKGGGTGLGLSICKRIMELSGGRIGVASQPGRGSTFFIDLPLGKLAPPPPPLSQMPSVSGAPSLSQLQLASPPRPLLPQSAPGPMANGPQQQQHHPLQLGGGGVLGSMGSGSLPAQSEAGSLDNGHGAGGDGGVEQQVPSGAGSPVVEPPYPSVLPAAVAYASSAPAPVQAAAPQPSDGHIAVTMVTVHGRPGCGATTVSDVTAAATGAVIGSGSASRSSRQTTDSGAGRVSRGSAAAGLSSIAVGGSGEESSLQGATGVATDSPLPGTAIALPPLLHSTGSFSKQPPHQSQQQQVPPLPASVTGSAGAASAATAPGAELVTDISLASYAAHASARKLVLADKKSSKQQLLQASPASASVATGITGSGTGSSKFAVTADPASVANPILPPAPATTTTTTSTSGHPTASTLPHLHPHQYHHGTEPVQPPAPVPAPAPVSATVSKRAPLTASTTLAPAAQPPLGDNGQPLVPLTSALVVDDVKSNRDLFGRLLNRKGVSRVNFADDGSTCIESIRQALAAAAESGDGGVIPQVRRLLVPVPLSEQVG